MLIEDTEKYDFLSLQTSFQESFVNPRIICAPAMTLEPALLLFTLILNVFLPSNKECASIFLDGYGKVLHCRPTATATIDFRCLLNTSPAGFLQLYSSRPFMFFGCCHYSSVYATGQNLPIGQRALSLSSICQA